MIEGGRTVVRAEDEVVSKVELKALQKRINQLERLLGRKTLEVEILREAVGLPIKENFSCSCHRSWRTIPDETNSGIHTGFSFRYISSKAQKSIKCNRI